MGHEAWNKGLTKEMDVRVKKNGEGTSKGKTGIKLSEEHCRALKVPHPGSGNFGERTEEYKTNMSKIKIGLPIL